MALLVALQLVWRSLRGLQTALTDFHDQASPLIAELEATVSEANLELARVDGIIPMLRQTADFNWHRQSALALLRHSQFRRILLSSLWS